MLEEARASATPAAAEGTETETTRTDASAPVETQEPPPTAAAAPTRLTVPVVPAVPAPRSAQPDTAPPAGSSGPGRLRAALHRRRHVLGVGLIAAVSAIVYSAYLLVLNASLQDGLPDVGEFDQAVSGYAHFHGPNSPFVGLSNLAGSGTSQLSDHFTPLLALLAPGYWIYDGPQTMLIETAILAALPMIPLWLFTRRALNTPAAW